MNTINMPGFTADKSVYRTNGYYRLSAGNADGSAREVLPMLGKTCGACRANSDCRKVDNYCGGCYCLALGPGETGPRCDNPVNISNNSANDDFPAWAPNGRSIAFSSDRFGSFDVFIMNTDGASFVERHGGFPRLSGPP